MDMGMDEISGHKQLDEDLSWLYFSFLVWRKYGWEGKRLMISLGFGLRYVYISFSSYYCCCSWGIYDQLFSFSFSSNFIVVNDE